MRGVPKRAHRIAAALILGPQGNILGVSVSASIAGVVEACALEVTAGVVKVTTSVTCKDGVVDPNAVLSPLSCGAWVLAC